MRIANTEPMPDRLARGGANRNDALLAAFAHHANFARCKIAAGNVLVSVHVSNGDERDVAKKIFERANATDVVTVGEESVPSERRAAR